MVSVEQAARIIANQRGAWPVESLPILDAVGRSLAETIRADRDQPPYDRVTMDGIAVAWRANARQWRIEKMARAGAETQTLKNRREGCVEVMTGAVLPRGCDTVIPYEDTSIREGFATLTRDAERGQYVHRRGSDLKRGALWIRPGVVLTATRIAGLAAVGRAFVRVVRAPRVAILSTGDEIIPVDQPAKARQIRPSNALGMAAALRRNGCEVKVPIVGDREAAIFQSLEKALKGSDVVIVSGGVSKGRADFVPVCLARAGVKKLFHGVSQQPGKPMWFGAKGRKLVFALPGNPVSSLVCFHRLVRSALFHSEIEFAELTERVVYEKPLTFFMPVIARAGKDGKLRATPVRYGGSGDLHAAGASDGFLELEKGKKVFEAGHVARFWRWAS